MREPLRPADAADGQEPLRSGVVVARARDSGTRGVGTGAMTIDVEDYFQVEAFASTIDRKDWDLLPSRVERNTHRLLDILAEAAVQATFFALGGIVRRYPSIARRIVADGHELASHGNDHIRVDRCSAVAFRADVHDSKRILEDAGGVAVHGYRAPTFSIGRENRLGARRSWRRKGIATVRASIRSNTTFTAALMRRVPLSRPAPG